MQSDPIGLAGGKNTYSYVNHNPLMGIDPLVLAEPNATNCEALYKWLDYLNKEGRSSHPLWTKKYNPYAFVKNIRTDSSFPYVDSDPADLLALNADFETTIGKVDIDWMYRSAATTTIDPVNYVAGPYPTYAILKTAWYVIDNAFGGNMKYSSILDEANLNGPKAVTYLRIKDISINEMFAPAIKHN